MKKIAIYDLNNFILSLIEAIVIKLHISVSRSFIGNAIRRYFIYNITYYEILALRYNLRRQTHYRFHPQPMPIHVVH